MVIAVNNGCLGSTTGLVRLLFSPRCNEAAGAVAEGQLIIRYSLDPLQTIGGQSK